MSELISGKEALIALANGSAVQGNIGFGWGDVDLNGDILLNSFITERNRDGVAVKFRLKPRTITLNNIEVPAPFEPKDGDKYYHISIQTSLGYGWDEWESSDYDARASIFGAWRTEEEIKQVVSALRSVFKGGVW